MEINIEEKFGVIVLPGESLDDESFFDLAAERVRLNPNREMVRSFHGVPIWYAIDGLPVKHDPRENNRRKILVAWANEQRVAKMEGGK